MKSNLFKSTLLMALLAVFMTPAARAANYYYASLTVNLATGSSGRGLVYANNSDTEDTTLYSGSAVTGGNGTATGGGNVNVYAYAYPNFGYKFSKWTSATQTSGSQSGSASTSPRYTYSLKAASGWGKTGEGNAIKYYAYAVFEDAPASNRKVINLCVGDQVVFHFYNTANDTWWRSRVNSTFLTSTTETAQPHAKFKVSTVANSRTYAVTVTASAVGTDKLTVMDKNGNVYHYEINVAAARVINGGDSVEVTCNTVASKPWTISSETPSVVSASPASVAAATSATVTLTSGKASQSAVYVHVNNYDSGATGANAAVGAEYTLAATVYKPTESRTLSLAVGASETLTGIPGTVMSADSADSMTAAVVRNGNTVTVTGGAAGKAIVDIETATTIYRYTVTVTASPLEITLCVGDVVKFNYDLGDQTAAYAQFQVYDGQYASASVATQGAKSGNFSRSACLTITALKPTQAGQPQQIDLQVRRSGDTGYSSYETIKVTVLPARLYEVGDTGDFTCIASSFLSGRGNASWTALTQTSAGIVTVDYSGAQSATAAGVHFVGAANGTTVVTAKNVTGSNGNLKGVEYDLKAAVIAPHVVTLAQGDHVQIWYNNTAQKTWSLILNGTTYAAGTTGQGHGFDAAVKTGSEGGGTAQQSYIDIHAKGASAASDLIIVTDGDNYYAYRMTCGPERIIKVGETAQVTCRTVSTFDWSAQVGELSRDYVSATCPPHDPNDDHGSTVTITGLEPSNGAYAYVQMHNEHFDAQEVNAQGAIYQLACKVVGGPIVQVHLSAGAYLWPAVGYWAGTNATYTVTTNNWPTPQTLVDKSQVGFKEYMPSSFTCKWHTETSNQGLVPQLEITANSDATKGDYVVYTVWAGDEKVVTYIVNVTTTFQRMIAVGSTAEGFLYGSTAPWVTQSSDPDICDVEPTIYQNLYSAKAIPKRAGDVLICSTNPVLKADYWGIVLKPYEIHERTVDVNVGSSCDETLPTNVYDPALVAPWAIETPPSGKVSAELTSGAEADATSATVRLTAGSSVGTDTIVVGNTYYVEKINVRVVDPHRQTVVVEEKYQVQVGSALMIDLSDKGLTGAWTAESEHGDLVSVDPSGSGSNVSVTGLAAGESVVTVTTDDKVYFLTVEATRRQGDLPTLVLWIDQNGNGQQLMARLDGQVPEGSSTVVTGARTDDNMIADVMAMGGVYAVMAKQEGHTWIHVQTSDSEYLQEVVVKLNHIDKRDIKLVFGKNGTHSTLIEKFYRIISVSNTADRVTVTQLGNEITIAPVGVLGHDEVFVECYQADYPNFPVTVHYWIDVEQRPGDEIREFDEGYIAYRGVSDIYEDDGDLVMTFTNVADLGQFTIPTGLTARIDMLAVGGGGGGGSVHGGLGTGGAGGGGAGGYSSVTNKKFQSGTFGITVGAGGQSFDSTVVGQSIAGGIGFDSYLTNQFGYVFLIGRGGGGGGAPSSSDYIGVQGGSGGGGAWNNSNAGAGGKGTDGQGWAGGTPAEARCGAGGGGAGGIGGSDQTGGPGLTSAISGTETLYAVGGRGGRHDVVAVGQPGSGVGNGGDGGSCATGGSGADGVVILRMTRLFKNILVPIPTTNDFIATLRTEWTNNVDVVPFPYENREFRSPTDMELRYWTEAIDRVEGSNFVHCAWGGEGGTNKVGVGYYSFSLYLKDGYAWDDGSQYGSTEYLRYNWVITEDINNVDARVEVKKTVIWEDGTPNATVRVSASSSPEMSGMKTPNVLFLGTLCNGHGMDVNVVTESLKTIVKVANVDYFLYSANSGATTDNPTVQGHLDVGEMDKVKISTTFSAPKHYAMTLFYKRLYTQLIAEATKKQYDYIVFEFDGSRLSDGYSSAYENEALVSAELKKFYESKNVIWIVDNCHAGNREPYQEDYWRPNTYWYNNYNNNMDIVQYRGLVGLFDPAHYVQGGTFAQISTAQKEWDTNWSTSYGGVNRDTVYANDRWDQQATYNKVDAVTDLLASVIKVKPYDLNFADKIMSPASGLTITGVTVQGSTNEVDWLDVITWTPGDVDQATADGFYGTVTPHTENYATLGFSNAVMQVTTNNEVFVDISNCTAKVVTRFDTHVHDDGTFCTSENAEYNQQTGKFEKNPNDGRARVGVVIGGTGGQGMDIDGDAETSIPWRYTAYEIRGHVNGNVGGQIFVGGTAYDKLSYQEGRDVTVYYRADGGYRLTALRADTTDHNTPDELEAYATGWTFRDIHEEHDVYVTFTKFSGGTESEPATNVYDGAAHVYPVRLVDWEDVYETEVRYATRQDAPDEEWLNEADFIATNSDVRAETGVGDHTYWYRIFALQPGYGTNFNDKGWVWVDTGYLGSNTVTITKAPLVITANSFKVDYNESPGDDTTQGWTFNDEADKVHWHGFEVEGLVEGDEIVTNGTIVIECPAYRKSVGQYVLMPTNAPGVADAVIDPSGNYQLEYRPGAVSVIKIPMVIGGVMQFGELDPEDPLVNTGVDRVVKTYDGARASITVRVDKPTGIGQGEGFHIQYSTDGESWTDENPTFIHAGTNKVWYSVTSGKDYEDSNYFYVTNYSYVIIEPAAIELTSASATKAYNGQELTRDKVDLTDGELFNGDTFTFTTTGSQTDVGTSDNTFDCSIVSGDEDWVNGTADYVITKKLGTLTVTPAGINIDGVTHPETSDPTQAYKYGETGVRDVTMTYDGTGTNISVNVVAPASGAVVHYSTNKNDAASWQTSLSFTEVGEYIVYFAVDAPNYASVTNFAKVTINPAPVTVTADDKYVLVGDSQPAYTATVGDLVLRDRGREAELISYPTPTCPTFKSDEGTYPIVFPEGETVERQGNYIVTFVSGTLSVDATARVGSLWITDHENLDDGTVCLAIKPTLSSGELTAETVVALAAEKKIKVACATDEEALKFAVPQPVELRDPTGGLDLDKGWIWVKVPVALNAQTSGQPVIWTVTIDR